MKITIDTQVDSPEDIRKVMQILGHFAGKDQKQRAYTNSNSYSEPNPYSQPAPSTTPTTPVSPNPNNQQNTSPDFSTFMGLMDQSSATAEKKEESEKKEIPRVMTF